MEKTSETQSERERKTHGSAMETAERETERKTVALKCMSWVYRVWAAWCKVYVFASIYMLNWINTWSSESACLVMNTYMTPTWFARVELILRKCSLVAMKVLWASVSRKIVILINTIPIPIAINCSLLVLTIWWPGVFACGAQESQLRLQKNC